MTVRSWNVGASSAAEAAPVVIILKKTQGSVWSEAGRTPLCPTLAWLRDRYGVGTYELRLKLGNRIACMVNAECKAPGAATLAAVAGAAAPGVAMPAQPAARLSRPLARTALGAW
jgi:hypothetical protein